MASDLDFIELLVDNMADAGMVTYRKMFGEYGVYCDSKIIGLVCNNQLFVKPTVAGREYLDEINEEPPYPGAKDYFLIGDRLEDREWLSELIRVTAEELPMPKPRTALKLPTTPRLRGTSRAAGKKKK